MALCGLLQEVSPKVAGPTIYVTHQADDARSLAEHVVTLDGGKLAAGDAPWTEGA